MLEIVRPQALFERLAHHPKIGIGEAYTAGDWRAGHGHRPGGAAAAVRRAADHAGAAGARTAPPGRRPPRSRKAQRNSRHRLPREHRGPLRPRQRPVRGLPRRDASATAPPSSTTPRPWSAQTLEAAQLRKVEAVLDLAAGRPRLPGAGDRHRLGHARHRGRPARCPGHHPHPVAPSRPAWPGTGSTPPGWPTAVDVRLQDYREVDGTYDAIVSVEMIEAVGEEYWPTYFSVLDQRLAPGGVVAIQAILMSHDRYLRHPQLLRLDPEAHLPRRPHPLAAGDRGDDAGGTPGCGSARCTRSVRTTPRPCAAGVTPSTQQWPEIAGRGLRRDLPPDLGVLPRLLRGRLRLGLPRRRAACG